MSKGWTVTLLIIFNENKKQEDTEGNYMEIQNLFMYVCIEFNDNIITNK